MAEPIRNVFISHKHEDDDGLQQLKRLVREHGMTWRDYSITADNPNKRAQRGVHQEGDSRAAHTPSRLPDRLRL